MHRLCGAFSIIVSVLLLGLAATGIISEFANEHPSAPRDAGVLLAFYASVSLFAGIMLVKTPALGGKGRMRIGKEILVFFCSVMAMAWAILIPFLIDIANIDTPREEMGRLGMSDYFMVALPPVLFLFYLLCAVEKIRGVSMVIAGIILHALMAFALLLFCAFVPLSVILPGSIVFLSMAGLWLYVCVRNARSPLSEMGKAAGI